MADDTGTTEPESRGHPRPSASMTARTRRQRRGVWITVALLALLAIGFYAAEVLVVVLELGQHRQ
ncbi:MAG: hypothetical protein U5K43_07095 [Halofilum sp. (in: g-proteobacteria)]|nr:hypothetical protein [Halofilum sp. (in: g-proteobacteria)]